MHPPVISLINRSIHDCSVLQALTFFLFLLLKLTGLP